MKIEEIECDMCKQRVNPAACTWETRPSVFSLTFPRDGINGGVWNMDVCASCRCMLHDAITTTINERRALAGKESQ